MTPLQLEVLMYFYCGSEPLNITKPVSDALEIFIKKDLIKIGSKEGSYTMTTLGIFYAEYILETPWPVSKYSIPCRKVTNLKEEFTPPGDE